LPGPPSSLSIGAGQRGQAPAFLEIDDGEWRRPFALDDLVQLRIDPLDAHIRILPGVEQLLQRVQASDGGICDHRLRQIAGDDGTCAIARPIAESCKFHDLVMSAKLVEKDVPGRR
jgi:hypothetical protein